MPQIKITSFKRLDNNNQNTEPKLLFTHKNKSKINVLFYTDQQNLRAKQLENWIRKQLKQKISFFKIVQEKSILHTFQTLINEKNQKIYLITTKIFTKEIKYLFRQNIKDSFQKVKFILLLDQLEKVPPQLFHLRNFSLITNELEKIKQILQSQILKLTPYNYQNQLSSINSQDQQNFENQFQKVSPVFNLHNGDKNNDQKSQQIVFNDNPGVGSYDISLNDQKFKGSKSGTFCKQKR